MPTRQILRILALALLPILLQACGETALSQDELLTRAQNARLQWDSYQEDIKGQIGATPAALWKGNPTRIQVEGKNIRVEFSVAPPWDTYAVAMPILLRGPLGKVSKNSGFEVAGKIHTYTFHVPELEELNSLPWVELHYPHTERRFTLLDGLWAGEI